MTGQPRFIISCQSCSFEAHLWSAAEKHKAETMTKDFPRGHSDYFLHLNGGGEQV